MFKKLKDKLAEEVKSSPQRIQLFAQAAQAAVTSASSSISDITNRDLFAIGDDDEPPLPQNKVPSSPASQHKTFQDISLMQSPADSMDFTQEMDAQRQRRLSNSSFTSDVSFRLPSYETPSMYHLQSDMEVSASEADDRGFSGGPATLDRVTKDQLYAAYKRTQERYKKYRTQYGDLARHYKLLERENAKARSVLVETQDKALRRISELKEQCSLEQSAKAHLEKALRVEIEEKNMKIETLNTKVQLLQTDAQSEVDRKSDKVNTRVNEKTENVVQLINLDSESNINRTEDSGLEISSLNNKIEKMEQLLNKYKESLKTSKEKNSQLTTELQILSKELENKDNHILDLKNSAEQLNEAKIKIQELNNLNEELQNQLNTFDFTKTKELSTLELDLQKANDEITELRSKIEVFNKREEEYAISLAENKLSIHKELEGKESEIKSLKDSLSSCMKEIQSLKIVIDDCKNNAAALEEEKLRLNNECAELNIMKNKIGEMDSRLQEMSKKCQLLEQIKAKAEEEYKCLQLQLKQETAEKLAMIDRNTYLETKNTQLSEENAKKNSKINTLEDQLQVFTSKNQDDDRILRETENNQLQEEMYSWKEKCGKLELEIQEEREELIKLQAEIEKLLSNHELIQTQNAEFRTKIANLTSEYTQQEEHILTYKKAIKVTLKTTLQELHQLKKQLNEIREETHASLQINTKEFSAATSNINSSLTNSIQTLLENVDVTKAKYESLKLDYDKLQTTMSTNDFEKTVNFNKMQALENDNNTLALKLTENASEIKLLNEKLQNSIHNLDSSVEKIKSLSNDNRELNKKVKEIEEANLEKDTKLEIEKAQHKATADKLNDTIQALEIQNKNLEVEVEQIKQEYEKSLEEITLNHNKMLKQHEDVIKTLTLEGNHNSELIDKIQQLETDKNTLIDKIKSVEHENNNLLIDIKNWNIKHESANVQLNNLNKIIDEKSVALEKYKEKQISLQNEYTISCNLTSELNNKVMHLNEQLKHIEDSNIQLNKELKEINIKHKASEEYNQELTKIVEDKSNENDTKQSHLNSLEEQIRNLTQENDYLKNETANFDSNIKKLELEIDDIKISHAKIETEKDHLNKIIEDLEKKQSEESVPLKIDNNSQTEPDNDNNIPKEEPAAVLENKWVTEHKQTLSSTASLNLKKENIDDLHEQYSALKINYDSLKDENRRLQSDVESLQSYLTKISKENSVLNDKLRELIATSEHSIDNDQLSSDVKKLRNEMQIYKEKVDDLQRENSLLIEENLELRDQLQSQNYATLAETKIISNNDKNLDTFKEKYNELLEANGNLEKQNIDLEQINKSVNNNMQQLHEKNERLKLSNEKLERRLDEALVSLRHLHSLQENTELEYLRNILYEYLTGSGTHSVTLAKVLAAIVKFDEGQTQLVLQKEKERQGFLRQLGII